MPPGTFAVVTGGGTAGHVLPALAVAEALVAKGHEASTIHYIGASRGVETRLLPETPFPHTFYDVVGFQRRLTRRNLGFIPKLLSSARAATRLLRDLRPRVVVSVGGYASVPAVLAARVTSAFRWWSSATTGSPVGRAGLPRAARGCFRGGVPRLATPKATVTGAPVRRAVLDVDRRRDGVTACAPPSVCHPIGSSWR